MLISFTSNKRVSFTMFSFINRSLLISYIYIATSASNKKFKSNIHLILKTPFSFSLLTFILTKFTQMNIETWHLVKCYGYLDIFNTSNFCIFGSLLRLSFYSMHIGRGLYYSSYSLIRTWTVGSFLFFLTIGCFNFGANIFLENYCND